MSEASCYEEKVAIKGITCDKNDFWRQTREKTFKRGPKCNEWMKLCELFVVVHLKYYFVQFRA